MKPIDKLLERITVSKARELSRQVGVLILWRPDPTLPEPEQYCLTPSF